MAPVSTKPLGYKRLYSVPEAAHYLGRSVWSVRRLVWAGDLPQVRAGGRVHLDVRDLDEFIEKNKVWEDSTRSADSWLDKEKDTMLPHKIT